MSGKDIGRGGRDLPSFLGARGVGVGRHGVGGSGKSGFIPK